MERIPVIPGHTHTAHQQCFDCSYVNNILNPRKIDDNIRFSGVSGEECNRVRVMIQERMDDEMNEVCGLAHMIMSSRLRREGAPWGFDTPLDAQSILAARDQLIENKRLARERARERVRIIERNRNVFNLFCVAAVSAVAFLYLTTERTTP